MKTIELFSGTASFSKVAKRLGHEIFTVDNNNSFHPDLCCNLEIIEEVIWDKIRESDVIWMSPPLYYF